MNIKSASVRSGFVGALLVLVTACSSTQVVEEDPVAPEPTQMEVISEQTGLSIEALEGFEEAVSLMGSDFSGAAEILERVVEMEPTFAEAHFNLGLLYSDMGRPEEAVVHIQTARELDPDVFDYTVAMAKAYAEAEEYENAQRLFNEVISREPDNLVAKNNMAVIALRQGDEEEAMRYVEEILREDNNDVGALNTLGLIYMERQNVSLAKYVLGRALEQDEHHVDALNNLGLVYMQENNVPSAVAAFNRAVRADGNYLESRLNLGSILIEYLDYERAHEHFENAVRIAPQNCVANLGKGATSFALGNHEDSYELYNYYIDECDPDHYSSYERLARLTENYLQRHDEAIRYYNKLIEMSDDPNDIANFEATVNFLQSQMDQAAQQKQVEPEPEEEVAEEEPESD